MEHDGTIRTFHNADLQILGASLGITWPFILELKSQRLPGEDAVPLVGTWETHPSWLDTGWTSSDPVDLLQPKGSPSWILYSSSLPSCQEHVTTVTKVMICPLMNHQHLHVGISKESQGSTAP